MTILDEEGIKQRRIPIEEVAINTSKKQTWQCHYCNKAFSNEMLYMRHYCKEKDKALTLSSPVGQSAFALYQSWMTMQRYAEPSSDAFLASKYFQSFIKFAELIRSAGITKPDRYIQIMMDHKVLPTLWSRQECYSMYIAYMDQLVTPEQQVLDTVDLLQDFTETNNVEMSNVFNSFSDTELVDMFRKRKISPWCAFLSKTFAARLSTMSQDSKKALEAIVNRHYWADAFVKQADLVAELKDIISLIGL